MPSAPVKTAYPLERIRGSEVEWELLGTHGLKRRMLGEDRESGHVTNLVHIPKGWRGGGISHFHDAFEEVYMLEGSVTLDGHHYFREGVYFYRPAHVVHGHDERSEEGALALVRSDGHLVLNLVHDPAQPVEYPLPGSTDPRGHVFEVTISDVAPRRDPAQPDGWLVKPLSMNPQTGARTFEVVVPSGWTGQASTLGQPWEAYVLEGSLDGDQGSWVCGDYTTGDSGTPLFAASSSITGARLLIMAFEADA